MAEHFEKAMHLSPNCPARFQARQLFLKIDLQVAQCVLEHCGSKLDKEMIVISCQVVSIDRACQLAPKLEALMLGISRPCCSVVHLVVGSTWQKVGLRPGKVIEMHSTSQECCLQLPPNGATLSRVTRDQPPCWSLAPCYGLMA